jgi:hypothetical protein
MLLVERLPARFSQRLAPLDQEVQRLVLGDQSAPLACVSDAAVAACSTASSISTFFLRPIASHNGRDPVFPKLSRSGS